MYSIYVRDHFMIAHSFQGEVFGPAQKLHGATYNVTVEFRRPELEPEAIVVDIGRAGILLKEILGDLNYKNLDEDESLAGRNTTTEVLAETIFSRMAERLAKGDLGAAGQAVTGLRVVLEESFTAGASYEGPVGPAAKP